MDENLISDCLIKSLRLSFLLRDLLVKAVFLSLPLISSGFSCSLLFLLVDTVKTFITFSSFLFCILSSV